MVDFKPKEGIIGRVVWGEASVTFTVPKPVLVKGYWIYPDVRLEPLEGYV